MPHLPAGAYDRKMGKMVTAYQSRLTTVDEVSNTIIS